MLKKSPLTNENILENLRNVEDNDLIAFHLYGCECNINAKKATISFASEIIVVCGVF